MQHRFSFFIVLAAVLGLLQGPLGRSAQAQTSCTTGPNRSISTANTVVNAYIAGPELPTPVNVPAGSLALPVDPTTLRGQGSFAAGDLVMIIQMQGARIDQREENTINGRYGDGAGGADRQGVLSNDFTAGTYELAVAAGPVAGKGPKS